MKSLINTIAVVLLALSLCFISCTSGSSGRLPIKKPPIQNQFSRMDSIQKAVNAMAYENAESFMENYKWNSDSTNYNHLFSCTLADETIYTIDHNGNQFITTSNPAIYRKYSDILKSAQIKYSSGVISSESGYKEYFLSYTYIFYPERLEKWKATTYNQ